MKNSCLILMLLFMLSCQIKQQNGYIQYQTFDEYKLIGVGNTEIKEPYVLVKKELDTIFVIKSNDKEKVIKYINKGDYWYSKSIIEVEAPPDEEEPCLLDMTPTVCEKFIYNDTIIEYKYQYDYQIGSSKRNNQRIMSDILVHTKKNCLILSIQDDDITNYDDPFNELKAFVTNYKEIFPLYSPGDQLRYCTIYEKRIERNILSIYEINGENKRFVSSKIINNLGEFDNKGMLAWWW